MKPLSDSDTLYIQRPGGRIAYDLIGVDDGPLVVCIPGMGDLRSVYAQFARSLAEAGYRVACADLRGHGDSDATFASYGDQPTAEDAAALIAELVADGDGDGDGDGEGAIVVGNSLGAASAVLLASQVPTLVSALVLLGPFVRNPETPAASKITMRLLMAGPWSTRVWLAFLPNLYPTRRGEKFTAHRQEIAQALRRPGRARAFRLTTRADHSAAWVAASSVQQPCIVIMGSLDPDFPDPEAEAHDVAERLGAHVHMIADAGHYPQAEFPEVTSSAVRQFLADARRG